MIAHAEDTVIYKLTHNQPLTESEYAELERILTRELGSRADYEEAYQDTPFGIMIRKIAGMDHGAVQEVFADFINRQGLNPRQIQFVNRVIQYIETNGYIRATEDLIKPPFDRPANILQLFDEPRRRELLRLINGIRENAERHRA